MLPTRRRYLLQWRDERTPKDPSTFNKTPCQAAHWMRVSPSGPGFRCEISFISLGALNELLAGGGSR
jgi:hypothetical protein